MKKPENDLLGKACGLYFHQNIDVPVQIFINDKPDNDLSPSYFFRGAAELNTLERTALLSAKGRVLDVGAGAGCHSVILQSKGLSVVAVEKSRALADIMKKRGIHEVVCADIMQYEKSGFDTILLLMNGFGLAGTDLQLEHFLLHLSSMLNTGGSIIGESTDISYFHRQPARSVGHDLTAGYFGNVTFRLEWEQRTVSLPWLFADEWLIRETCQKLGMKFTIMRRGSDHQFLCRITKP